MRLGGAITLAIGLLMLPTAAAAAPRIVGPGAVSAGARLAAPVSNARADAQPAGASAPTGLDLSSDHAALADYSAYLLELLKQAPSAQANDASYIAQISSPNGCKSALAPLAQSSTPPDAATARTLRQLGVEIGDDLAIAYEQAMLPAFAHFAAQIDALSWSRGSGGPLAVHRYVRSESRVLSITQSQLCQDVLLAAATPQSTPAATLAFIHQYARAARLADAALVGLTGLMQLYATNAERGLLEHIGILARQVNAVAGAELRRGGAQLEAALES